MMHFSITSRADYIISSQPSHSSSHSTSMQAPIIVVGAKIVSCGSPQPPTPLFKSPKITSTTAKKKNKNKGEMGKVGYLLLTQGRPSMLQFQERWGRKVGSRRTLANWSENAHCCIWPLVEVATTNCHLNHELCVSAWPCLSCSTLDVQDKGVAVM